MRLTSIMWLGVFMKLETSRGAYVTVVKKGEQQAGALFIVQNHLDGTGNLFGPAPQAFFEKDEVERQFELLLDQASHSEIDAYIEKQKNFDPDLWVVETESGNGPISLTIRH